MLCKRIIGVVMIDNGNVVIRKNFKTISIIGNPRITFKYLQNWNIDELFIINVGEKQDVINILNQSLKKVFIPVTIGGNISTLEEAKHYISNGADKVVIGKNASFYLLDSICSLYGEQAVCLSVDSNHKDIPDYPCGEIVLHDTKRDGSGNGLNLDILKEYSGTKSIIAMGGVGSYQHITDGLKYADAVAVGNLFQFKEICALQAKKECFDKNINVRI